MYAAIRVYANIKDVDEVVRRADAEFLPLIREIDGFRGYYLVDTGDGSGATISLFDDRASAEKSTSAAVTWVRENFAELIEGAPQVVTGEVRIQHVKE
jgi:hypothetical protein